VKKAISILLPTLFALYCQAQTFTVLQYSKSEGVPSSEVYEIYQDKKGFIWFATDNGVARFDGSEMKTFHTAHGLSDEVVFGFHEDFKGRLWFRTFSGKLSYYENDSIYTYRHNNLLTHLVGQSIIGSIYIDSLERLWFTTLRAKGLYGSISGEGEPQAVFQKDYEVHYQQMGPHFILGYKQQRLTKISINNKLYSFQHYSGFCSQLQILSVRWKGRLYFSMCQDLYEFDGENFKYILSKPSAILSLSKDRDDNLWIGYLSGGTERFSEPDFREGWSPEFLRSASVTKVMQDYGKGFWFSTLEHGVFHVPDFSIANYKLDETKKIQQVASSDDQVVIATNEGDVIGFGKEAKQLYTKRFSPPVTDLFITSKKYLWVSANAATYVMDSSYQLKKQHGLTMTSLSEDNEGFIWGLNGHYISYFSPEGKALRFKLTSHHCRKLIVSDSLLLIPSRTGANLYSREGDLLSTVKALDPFKISGMYPLDKSTLIITTIGNGFVLFDMQNKTLKPFPSQNKFIASNIYTLVKVNSFFWLGTEKGIVRLQADSLLIGVLSFHVLDKKSGVIGNEITHLRYFPPNVWAFSDQGFSIVPASTKEVADTAPQFYLKYMTASGNPLPMDKTEPHLSYDQNNIQIAFGYIAFRQHTIYSRYRLSSAQNWNYTEAKSIQFNALAPGSYQLELQYSNDNIIWMPAFTSTAWIIERPLWQTWYFITGIALVVLLLIFLYFKNQVRLYRKHQLKLIQSEIDAIENERSRIAKDLHDSVGTDFTAIKMTVSQLLKKHHEPKSEEIETQFQSTIHEIKSIIYGLSPPGLERYGLISAVKNYIAKLNDAIPLRIELKAFGPDVKDPRLNIAVFRVLQELISNSLKHSNAQVITLHISSFDDLLNIVYEDNGKGFSWELANKGLGLYNIESRIQSVNGQLRFDSGPFGISYTIDIPLKKEHQL
jgi:signal transduction histidine kinase